MSDKAEELIIGETLTENAAFADLIVWAATRPTWQKDALRLSFFLY
jgi:hypothetical protein